MSNELTTNVNPLDIINANNENAIQSVTDSISSSTFIPSLSISYAISKSFSEQGIMPGHFVLGGKVDLSDTINICAIDFRAHAAKIIDNEKRSGECYHLDKATKPETNSEWQEFVKAPLLGGEKLVVGSDVFCYLPDQKAFCLLFMKGTLAYSFNEFTSTCKGGRFCVMSTIAKAAKGKQWYNLIIKPTDKKMLGGGCGAREEIAYPADQFVKYHNLFTNPNKGIENAQPSDTLGR
jgi:hypothetical protein